MVTKTLRCELMRCGPIMETRNLSFTFILRAVHLMFHRDIVFATHQRQAANTLGITQTQTQFYLNLLVLLYPKHQRIQQRLVELSLVGLKNN